MERYFLLKFLITAAMVIPIQASHFRGGVIKWSPEDRNPPLGTFPVLRFSYRIAFRRSYQNFDHSCDPTHIDTGELKDGEGFLTCDKGCTGLNEPLDYVCTDFSDPEDWTSGVGTATYTPATNIFDVQYEGNAWIDLKNGGGSSWIIRSHVDLTRRSDNGLINSSPTSSNMPIIRIQKGCPARLVIPVTDPDPGDIVRCRFAEGSNDECGSICGRLDPGASIDETTCVLQWTPTGGVGLYGVSIQIEDFMTSTDVFPLSSIPLQFLIEVFENVSPCGQGPVITDPSPPAGSCIAIPPGTTAMERIQAVVSDPAISVVSITTVSPVGLTTTAVRQVPGSNLNYIVDVTWTPQTLRQIQEIFCYVAEDSQGLTSEQACIFFVTQTSPPVATSVEFVSDTELVVVFDQVVERPTIPARINILSTPSRTVAYSIDTQSPNVRYSTTEGIVTIAIPRGQIFANRASTYVVELEYGAVVSVTFCGIQSAAGELRDGGKPIDTITCPVDIDIINTAADIYVPVSWIEPILPTGVVAEQIAGPDTPMATYIIGSEDTICYIFLSTNGTAYTCEFTIRIGPDPHPCPGDIYVDAVVGTGGTVATWTEPVTRDQVLSDPPLPGSFFEIGINPVCYTFINIAGETDLCTFSVVVEEKTPCTSTSCGDFGTCCPESLTTFTCSCSGCYSGQFCEEYIHACNTSQCQNGSPCVGYEGSCSQYYCECPPCFTGQFCQLPVDACSNHKCQNEGVCIAQLESCDQYTCECTGCTFGTYCENVYDDPCDPNPCSSGDTCGRVPNTCSSYTCVAANDLGSAPCVLGLELNPVGNLCNSYPCQNGGSCICTNEWYECLCRDGYGGENCNGTLINVCSPSTCINGQCFNSYSSDNGDFVPQYTCVCDAGFSGFNCALPAGLNPIEADPCLEGDAEICQNNGICSTTYTSTNQQTSYICECPIGYFGQRCDTLSFDQCVSNPCQNDGICTAFNTYFECECINEFTGPTCENLPEDTIKPVIINCPDHVLITSDIPIPAFWQYPDVTDNSGYPAKLVSANSAPGAVYASGASAKVELVYEDFSGNRATCKFVIVITATSGTNI